MTATALQRLLKHPHAAVFDKTPVAELALRLRHPAGATWRIADETLIATAGGLDQAYDLSQYTVASLADALQSDGFEVAYLSPEFAARGASVLVEGAGDQAISNGDHLTAFTSPLWALFGGYAREVRAAEYLLQQALRQMVITQAEGEWLDLWGALYAEARLPGESDASYAPRIPEEAFRVRVNGLAIEKAIHDRTGRNIEIREPWRRMFALNQSPLSGADHLPDDRYYSYFVIHPVARESIDWSEVLPVIERNRPTGIEVYSPSVEFPVGHVTAQPPAEYLSSVAGLQLRSMAAWPGGENPLGVMRLSDNEITLNHPVMIYSVMTFSNVEGAQTQQGFGAPRSVAYASVALSDGVPLGDENAILSRGFVSYSDQPTLSLSEVAAPSDYDVVRVHERVERVVIETHAALLEFPVGEITAGSRLTAYFPMRFFATRVEEHTWTGGWAADHDWYGTDRTMGMKRVDTPAGDILNDTLILNISVIT